jgi:ABC-2 type transport system permease protein
MRYFILVLNVKATGFLKSLFDRRTESIVKNLSSALIFGGVAVSVFLLSRGVTGYLLGREHIGLFLFHRFLSMLLYVFFVTVNLGNVVVCFATLYRSEEVSYLMSMPVPHHSIFALRFIDNFFYSSGTMFLLALALLLGYGSYFSVPWYFYVFTLVGVLLPLMMIAALSAVILLVFSVRLANRIGVRSLIGGVGTLYLLAIYLYFSFTNPANLVREVMRHYPDVNAYFGYLDPSFIRYLPSHWVADFLYWTMSGDPTRAGMNLLMLYLTFGSLLIAAALVGDRYYYKSWLIATDGHALRKERDTRFRSSGILSFGQEGMFPRPVTVLLKRDFWLFFREPGQWLHLMLMVVLLGVFLLSLQSLDIRVSDPQLLTGSYLVILLFDGFLIASVALRFVFPAVSLEGETYWSVRSAPLLTSTLYWQKFSTSLTFVLIFAGILAIGSSPLMLGNRFLIILSFVLCGLFGLTMTAINMGAGAYFATYQEKNPIRVASSQGASLTFLGGMIYLGSIVLLLVPSLNRYFELMILRGSSPPQWLLVPMTVATVLSATIAMASTAIGLSKIRRDC